MTLLDGEKGEEGGEEEEEEGEEEEMPSQLGGRGGPVELEPLSPDPDSPVPFDENTLTGEFDNGMQYYVRQNVMPRNRAELRVAIKVGSTQEEEHERGIAHMIEHLAFRATKSTPEEFKLVKELETHGVKFGAHQNAYTSFEETVFELHIPTDKDGLLKKSCHILQQLALEVRVSDDDVDRERSIVVEEWRQSRGSGQRIAEDYTKLLLQGSLYAERLPIGLLEVINGVSPQVVRDFYARHYHPNRMAVIAVGDFPAGVEQIRDLLEEVFGGGKGGRGGGGGGSSTDSGTGSGSSSSRSGSGAKPESKESESVSVPVLPRPAPREPIVVPSHDKPRIKIYTDSEATSTSINIDVKQPDLSIVTADDYRQSIVEDLFYMALSTRLAKVASVPHPPFLSARGGCESVVRWVRSAQLSVICRDGDKSITKALNALLREVDRVKTHGLTDREVQICKANMEAVIRSMWLERAQNDSASLCAELSDHFLRDVPAPGIEWEAAVLSPVLEGITTLEVTSICNAHLHFGADTVVHITKPKDGMFGRAYKAIFGSGKEEEAERQHGLTTAAAAAATTTVGDTKRAGAATGGKAVEGSGSLTELRVEEILAQYVSNKGHGVEEWGHSEEEVTIEDLLPPGGVPRGGKVVSRKHFPGCCGGHDHEESTDGGGGGGGGDGLAEVSAREGQQQQQQQQQLQEEEEGGGNAARPKGEVATSVNAYELELSNGLNITYRCSDYHDDEIVFSGFANGGLSELSDAFLPSGALATVVAEELGVFGRDPTELLDILTGKRVTLRTHIDTYGRDISGSCSIRDLEACLQLIHVIFTAPIKWDQARLHTVMGCVREGIANQTKDPQSVYYALLEDVNTQRHSYFRSPELSMLSNVQPRYSAEFFRMCFTNPKEFRFAFCGNLEPEEAVPLFEKYLGSIEAPSAAEPLAEGGEGNSNSSSEASGRPETDGSDEGGESEGGDSAGMGVSTDFATLRRRVERGLHSESKWMSKGVLMRNDVRALHVSFPSRTVKKMLRMRMKESLVLTTLTFYVELGGKEHPTHAQRLEDNMLLQFVCKILERRLTEVLRFHLGSIYTVSVGLSFDTAPPTLSAEDPLPGTLSVSLTCRPGVVGMLHRMILREIKGLQAEGPRDFEVSNAVEGDRTDRETAKRTNGFWLSNLLTAYISPRYSGDVAATYDEGDAARTLLYSKMDALVLRQAFCYFFKAECRRRTEVTLVPQPLWRSVTKWAAISTGVAAVALLTTRVVRSKRS